MSRALKKITLYIIITSIVLLILFFSLSAPMITSNSDFSVYNPGWNGCSDLAVRTNEIGKFTPNLRLVNGRSIEVTQKELTSYSLSPNSTSLMILGPEESFSKAEVEYVHDFIEEGGILVLSDDFGQANSLLQGLNTSSRFYGEPVLDLSFEKKPDFGVAYEVQDHKLTQNVSLVLLNKPTGIIPDENSTSLLNTSKASWIDRNDNGIHDPGERKGHVPLLTIEDYGEGKLILVSDPSIFINSMREELDNDILTNNILNYSSENRKNVIFDESHREVNLLQGLVYRGEYPSRILSVLIITLGLGASLFIAVPDFKNIILRYILYLMSIFSPQDEEKDIVDNVIEKHPDWDKDKLEMINKRFREAREKGVE